MDSFTSILDNVISELNIKYGFNLEAADFKPELVMSYGDGVIPNKPGSKDGDSQGTGHTKKFWDQRNHVWLPKDLYNATRSITPSSAGLKNMSKEDKAILLDKMKDIKGDLEVMDFIKSTSSLFDKLFATEDDFKNRKEDEESVISKINKEIKDSLKRFVSENASAIDSRSKVISDVDKTFGSDVAQAVKKVILRAKNQNKAKSIIEEGVDTTNYDYSPEFNPSQKELTKEDRNYILKLLKEYGKEGVPSILKKLIGKYPKKILTDLKDASEKYGDVKGIVIYLGDYEEKKEELRKWQDNEPAFLPERGMPEIEGLLKPVSDFINKVKKTLDISNYENTFLGYTEQVINAIKAYSRSSKRIPEFEYAIVDILSGEHLDKNSSLTKAWRDAKVPGMTKLMADLPTKLSDEFDFEKYEVVRKNFKDNPDLLYKNMDKMESQPKFMKDMLRLKSNPPKFEHVETSLDDEGKVKLEKFKLNKEDLEFVEQVKSLMKEDNKEKNKEIRDDGQDDKQIKQRNKDFKDSIKTENREELLKTINDLDAKELAQLESDFEKRKKQITDLRKKLRAIKKIDEASLLDHLKELRMTLTDSEQDTKILKRVQKLEDQIKTVKTMSDKQKEEVKSELEAIEEELEKSMNSKDSIQKMLKRFKDLDSWVKDLDKKKKDDNKRVKEEKNRYVDTSELSESDLKEYLKNFEDAMVVHYLNEFPEMMYEKVPNESILKRVDKLNKELKELEAKEDKTKKDEQAIKDLKSEITKMEGSTTKKLRDEAGALSEIRKLRERFKSLNNGKDVLMLSEDDYKKYVSEVKVKDEAMQKILEKAGVDFERMRKDDPIVYKLKDYEDKKEKPRSLTRHDKTDEKKSSVALAHSDSIFYKLEKMASISEDAYIKAEILDISEKLKDLI